MDERGGRIRGTWRWSEDIGGVEKLNKNKGCAQLQ